MSSTRTSSKLLLSGQEAIASRVDVYGDGLNTTLLEKLNIRVKEIEEKYTEPVNKPRPENRPKFQRSFDRNDRSYQKKKPGRFKNRKRNQFGQR